MSKKTSAQIGRAIKNQNRSMIKAALDTCKGTKSKYLFLYVDAVDEDLLPESLPKGVHLVLLTKKKNFNWKGKPNIKDIIIVPKLKLGRMGLIKIGIILAAASKTVNKGDSLVYLGGKAENGLLDFILSFQIGEDSEIITDNNLDHLPETVNPDVFEHALNLAIELSIKGREGKPVGTIFVLGDDEKVMQLSKQMIINPFKGYSEEERNLLNPQLKDTIIEFSGLDGAIVISGTGEVIAAGRYLGAATDESDIPRGLGARHIAAGGITALTNAIAIVISESTGDVRILRDGKVIMSIEKPSR